MFASVNVLPSEDPALFLDRMTGVHGSLNPRNQAEYLLADEVGRSSWLYDRALRAQTARISKKIYESSFEHEEIVHGWGRRLFFDRRGPTSLYGIGKGNGCGGRTSYSGIPDDPDDPARLIRLISRSTYGCHWMLSHWNGLRELLVTGRTWQAQHRLMATRLMGHQPLDACTVEDVAQVYLRSWTINQERENAWREHRSELRREEYYRFCQRVRGQHGLHNSHDKAQERATLVFVVDKVIADVKEKLALAEAREAKEAALDADCLAFDDSPEGERLRRYELAAHRRLMRSLDAFMKLRKEDFEDNQDDAGESESEDAQDAVRTAPGRETETDQSRDVDDPNGDSGPELLDSTAYDPTTTPDSRNAAIDPTGTAATSGTIEKIARDAAIHAGNLAALFDPAGISSRSARIRTVGTASAARTPGILEPISAVKSSERPQLRSAGEPSGPDMPLSRTKTNGPDRFKQPPETGSSGDAGLAETLARLFPWVRTFLLGMALFVVLYPGEHRGADAKPAGGRPANSIRIEPAGAPAHPARPYRIDDTVDRPVRGMDQAKAAIGIVPRTHIPRSVGRGAPALRNLKCLKVREDSAISLHRISWRASNPLIQGACWYHDSECGKPEADESIDWRWPAALK
jgi:hypothetical protein